MKPKPRVAKVPRPSGPARWCVIREVPGFIPGAIKIEECRSWREAWRKAQP